MTQPAFWRSPLDPERVMSAPVAHWQEAERVEREEYLTVEEPLEIRLGERALATIMRTPGHDAELACGFLLSEGLIQQAEDVVAVRPASDSDGLPLVNVVDIRLREPLMSKLAATALQRHFTVSASCGLCGKDSIADILCTTAAAGAAISEDHVRISASCLYNLPERLRQAQDVFSHTGGLHAAALFDACGQLCLLREDIGRHNAVDKLIGHGVLERTLPYTAALLLVSGRTSFEIIQKALRAHIPCIAAISAPSSLAVELAAESGITLIGFLRSHTMNVYTHPERIIS